MGEPKFSRAEEPNEKPGNNLTADELERAAVAAKEAAKKIQIDRQEQYFGKDKLNTQEVDTSISERLKLHAEGVDREEVLTDLISSLESSSDIKNVDLKGVLKAVKKERGIKVFPRGMEKDLEAKMGEAVKSIKKKERAREKLMAQKERVQKALKASNIEKIVQKEHEALLEIIDKQLEELKEAI